jgi:hypothetical protein
VRRIEFERVELIDDDRAIVVLAGGAVVPALRIWVGSREAALVSIAATGRRSSRPLTHDLIQTLMHDFGLALEWVLIAHGEDGLFVAELVVSGGGGRSRIDCRPADAIALALREGAPMFLADEPAS